MKDIIQQSLDVTNSLSSTSFKGVLTTMLLAAFCGAVIYIIYRFFYRGVVYSENFNVLLVLVCVVTAFIIKTISANLVLSLGMVGALSIVRFRAAVKDPLDVGFVFWSVAAGLTIGAQLYAVAVLCTIFIALLYIALNFVKIERKAFLLIARFNSEAEQEVVKALGKSKTSLKNKTLSKGFVELTVEIKGKNAQETLSGVMAVEGVMDCALMEYNGDYAN